MTFAIDERVNNEQSLIFIGKDVDDNMDDSGNPNEGKE